MFDPGYPDFWVLLALVAFCALLVYLKVIPGKIFAMLDAKTDAVRAELEEAERLRREAEALLAEIKSERLAAERQAAEMVANAEAEAKRYEAEAKVKLDEQVKRRAELAERKIAQAEAQAAAEVKAAAGELAAQMAEGVLAQRLAGAKGDPLVDQAIGQLASKLQ